MHTWLKSVPALIAMLLIVSGCGFQAMYEDVSLYKPDPVIISPSVNSVTSTPKYEFSIPYNEPPAILPEYIFRGDALYHGEEKITKMPITELFDFVPSGDPIMLEWHRFVKDNVLYIYLEEAMGCGGCEVVYKDYLAVDLATDVVRFKQGSNPFGKFDAAQPINTDFSPDGSRAAYLTIAQDDPLGPQVLYLYDFIKDTSTKILEVDPNMTLAREGMGYMLDSTLLHWQPDGTVKATPIRRNKDGSIPQFKN